MLCRDNVNYKVLACTDKKCMADRVFQAVKIPKCSFRGQMPESSTLILQSQGGPSGPGDNVLKEQEQQQHNSTVAAV